jgi:hypothetical protein
VGRQQQQLLALARLHFLLPTLTKLASTYILHVATACQWVTAITAVLMFPLLLPPLLPPQKWADLLLLPAAAVCPCRDGGSVVGGWVGGRWVGGDGSLTKRVLLLPCAVLLPSFLDEQQQQQLPLVLTAAAAAAPTTAAAALGC